MISKAKIHYIRQFNDKSHRLIECAFVVEGTKMLAELLQQGTKFKVRELYAVTAWLYSHHLLLKDIPAIVEVSDEELSKISMLQTPNQVLAIVEIPSTQMLMPTSNSIHILADRIQDPGNLGTIIRLADWFGISQIVCNIGTVDVYNPKVVQATMGSIFRVNVVYMNLIELLNAAIIPIYSCVLGGENFYEMELQTPCYVVLGNESMGISDEVLNKSTMGISIPSYSLIGDGAESLNVAMAASIVIAEFKRRLG